MSEPHCIGHVPVSTAQGHISHATALHHRPIRTSVLPPAISPNMPLLPHRRPRSHRNAFAHPALPSFRRCHPPRSPLCSLSPDSSTDTSVQRTDQLRNKLDIARQRVTVLNARVIVRVAEAGIRLGSTVLVDPTTEETDVQRQRTERDREKERESEQQLVKRLKKDLNSLRRMADDHNAIPDTLDVIARLSDVVNAVEHALHKRDAISRSDLNAEMLEDILLEGPVTVDDDLAWSADSDLLDDDPRRLSKQPDIVSNVRESVIHRGNQLRRTASDVGAGIEESVAKYVRDDGTIDVDALRAYVADWLDNAEMTWKRLNGRVPTENDNNLANGAVVVPSANLQVRDTDKEFRLREEIGDLENKLITSSKQREAVLRNEDQLGKLIRAKEIRLMDDAVCALRRTLAVRVLQLEVEKIFVSLADEIENSEYDIMMDQRMLVAEFGDLDERLSTLDLFVDENEPLLIEDDTVGELAADIQDLKSRLGIDDPLYSSVTLNWVQLRQFFVSSARKTRAGAEFYSRGIRLFAGDVRFALRLIQRAITGYTPSPREVRTLRRTGKDLLTLIPFTIVLIAPLTPVGHVLIFSLLQRYWPEFFPSTFSERRQTLMKRHEQYQILQTEAGEQNGTDGKEDDKTGPMSIFKRMFFFDSLTTDASPIEDKGDVGGETTVSTKGNGLSNIDENGTVREEEHPVDLNELAESVREKRARKKRFGLALDELHLAD